jgi:hypothetical protein
MVSASNPAGLLLPRPARLALVIVIAAGALLLGATPGVSGPRPPTELPACGAGEKPATHSRYDDWADTLLDPSFGLPATYEPPDLEVRRVGGRAVILRAFVFGPLSEMIHAAHAASVSLRVNSGYRSFAEQARLARDPDLDPATVAPAGHSEHQLGTTIDVSGDEAWLSRNASRFGFVMSYPASRSPEWTCYPHEPWHFRYFGRERAAEITTSGLSPREWLWQALHDTAADRHSPTT